MEYNLGINEKRTIPGCTGRKALILYLVTGVCVYGASSLTGTTDTPGAELAGGTVFSPGWTPAGSGWTLTAGYADYSLGTATPANLIKRTVTGMRPHLPHKLIVTATVGVTGVFRVTLNGQVIGSITGVGTFEFIFRPRSDSEELVIAPEERASAAAIRLTNVSLKAFTSTRGIPLPPEQQLAFAANDPTTFAGPITLCAGSGGATVLVEEFV